MIFVILAAGEGKRLRPLTDDRPKCMVDYKGKCVIDRIISTANSCGIRDQDITIVGGYKFHILANHLSGKDIKFCRNKKYAGTNMVYSLFCAEEYFDDDIIISYADIVYERNVLKSLIEDNNPISVIIDRDWEKLWTLRMNNVLGDAETLKLDKQDFILEIGKKPKSQKDIEGQYIGLVKIRKDALCKVMEYYHNLDNLNKYDGKDLNNMFTTSFIQMINDDVTRVKAVSINGGWIEIDSIKDLDAYNKLNDHVNIPR